MEEKTRKKGEIVNMDKNVNEDQKLLMDKLNRHNPFLRNNIPRHQYMWRWIGKRKSNTKTKYLEINYPSRVTILNECFACEFAIQTRQILKKTKIHMCEFCPFIWPESVNGVISGGVRRKCHPLFDMWENNEGWKKIHYARQIAELPINYEVISQLVSHYESEYPLLTTETAKQYAKELENKLKTVTFNVFDTETGRIYFDFGTCYWEGKDMSKKEREKTNSLTHLCKIICKEVIDEELSKRLQGLGEFRGKPLYEVLDKLSLSVRAVEARLNIFEESIDNHDHIEIQKLNEQLHWLKEELNELNELKENKQKDQKVKTLIKALEDNLPYLKANYDPGCNCLRCLNYETLISAVENLKYHNKGEGK